MSLTTQQLAAARVKVAEFRQQAAKYFEATEDAIFKGLTYTANQADIKRRADIAKADYQTSLVNLSTIVEGGSYMGRVPTSKDVAEAIRQTEEALARYNKAVMDWNASSPVAIVTKAMADNYNLARRTLEALLTGIGEGVQTGASWIKWVPWVVVGALVLPTVLRIVAKKRREGTEAALDYTAESIESGRAATGRAITTGTQVAVRRAAGLPF